MHRTTVEISSLFTKIYTDLAHLDITAEMARLQQIVLGWGWATEMRGRRGALRTTRIFYRPYFISSAIIPYELSHRRHLN